MGVRGAASKGLGREAAVKKQSSRYTSDLSIAQKPSGQRCLRPALWLVDLQALAPTSSRVLQRKPERSGKVG